MVKDFSSVHNTVEINRLIKVLGENFTISQNPHMRKGGLLGLAAVAIALQKVIYFILLNILSFKSLTPLLFKPLTDKSFQKVTFIFHGISTSNYLSINEKTLLNECSRMLHNM